MVKLHFDIRDLFRVIRLGWSGKKIWVGLVGLLIAYVGYTVLMAVGHLVSGSTMGELWHQYGLFLCAQPGQLNVWGTIIRVIAAVWVLAVMLLASSMVCKITYQQLRGDDFYSSGDAWRFLKSNWSGVLLGPVAVLALFIFFIVVGIILGWLAWIIPVAGELLFAIFFIPIFFAALVSIFIAIALVVALSFSPAIVGTVGEDTLEVVIQSFSLVWSQPWRLVLYCLWMNVSVAIGVTVLGSFMYGTMWLLSKACGLFMQEKLANMLLVAHRYIPCSDDWSSLTCCLPAAGDPSGSELWAGRILAIMLLILAAVLLSYGMSTKASGLSLIYVILRKRKDDENLLEWEDETQEEDKPFVPEPTEEKAEESPEGKSEEEPKSSEDEAEGDKGGDEAEGSGDEDKPESGS